MGEHVLLSPVMKHRR